MNDPTIIFGALGAAAIVASGFSSYFGMRYGLNGMRDRMARIETQTQAIPGLQRDVAVIQAVIAERAHREREAS